MCAIICPEAIIEVYRDDSIDAEPGNKHKPILVKEKV